MRTNLLRFFRNLHQGDQLKPNRKLITLLFCIAISALFWLLNAYSKVYNSVIQYPVSYQNLPANRVLVNRLPSHINLMLRAQGFTLLYEKLTGRRDTVYVDIDGLNIRRRGNVYTGILNTSDRIDDITRQFDPEISLLRIIPDTIRFSFANRATREVQVKVLSRLSFKKQHQLRGKITTDPAVVKVSGPAFILDTLSYVYTDSLILSDLERNQEKEVRLFPPEDAETVVISPSTITAIIPVERFTEASVTVPIEAVNVPREYDVKLLPAEVKVVYLVPFSKYEEVTPRSFSVRADFSNASGKRKISAEVITAPAFVTQVKVEPDKIEYILRKK